MNLSAEQLADVRGILDKIDQGLIRPRIPGPLGRYFRQYGHGRRQVDEVLARRGVERRADDAVSGRSLSPVEVYPLLRPELSVLGFPLGEVAETLVISEQLGGLVNLTMWLKGPVANAAYNILRTGDGIRLSGDYRWTPPARVTPGEARVQASETSMRWQDARCIKAVADDLTRPAHALEYVLDYRLGRPGLKHFRCVCAMKAGAEWLVLPALERPIRLETAQVLPKVEHVLNAAQLATVLIYCEPWSRSWTLVDASRIDESEAFAHVVTWTDFQKELDGSEIEAALMTGLRASLRAAGVEPSTSAQPNLTRHLLPVARNVVRWLRGSLSYEG